MCTVNGISSAHGDEQDDQQSDEQGDEHVNEQRDEHVDEQVHEQRGRPGPGDLVAVSARPRSGRVPGEREIKNERRLPLAWYDVLLELNAAPGRTLRMQDLAGRVVLSRSRVSRVVDELSRAGHARREPDPDDRRGAYTVLTDSGRAELRVAAPVYLAGIEEHFTSHLDAEHLRAMHEALGRVLAANDPGPS